jgi:hypothetical protein
MRKHIGMALLVVVGLAVAPSVARAQMARHNMGNQPTEGLLFGAGAGLTLPVGDYSTTDNLGWHAMGLVQMPLHNTPIHLRFDLMYGQTGHKAPFSGSTKLFGGTVDAVYHMGDRAASLRPYVLGGLGLYNVSNGSSTSAFAFGFGGGVLFGVGATMHGFAEARYMNVSKSGGSLAFIPITVGLMFSAKQ